MHTKENQRPDGATHVLGQRLRECRLARGWSIRQLERRSGVSNSAISLIEQGARTQPRTETIRRLAEALGVSPAYLAGFHDDPTPQPAAADEPPAPPDRVSESPETLSTLLAGAPPEVIHWVTLFAKFALKEHLACRRIPLPRENRDE